MTKIAIWGYGNYGRRMFESLTRFCSEVYKVVRVYDISYQELKDTKEDQPLQIHNPAELLEDYKNGLFEKVLLCLFNEHVSKEPRLFLREHSIPELHLGRSGDLCHLSSFEQGEKPFSINQEGYDFYVLKNLCGAMSNYESDELLYLFNNEGQVVKEHWDRWDINSNAIPCAFDYPFVLKNSKAEKIFFEGQYCVLTKKHSGNYWHFTYSCLDIIWLLEQSGFEGKYVIPNKKFCCEILQIIGVSPERIVTLRNFEHNKIYVFEEVFYVTIREAQEKYGTPVLLEAAAFIKSKLPIDPSLPKKIYVKRIGKRKLLGANKLLEEYGFTTMIPENYSVKEQMTLFYNADIVFCVHGANSTNCLYMRKNTVFIEAFSSYWINRCNLYTVAAAEVHYLPVSTLETVWTNEDGISRDFTIPEVLLRMTIQNAFLIHEAKQGVI